LLTADCCCCCRLLFEDRRTHAPLASFLAELVRLQLADGSPDSGRMLDLLVQSKRLGALPKEEPEWKVGPS
jgi:hypothetical protein